MYCRNCGKKLNDNVKFCTECGTAVQLDEFFGAADNNAYGKKPNNNYSNNNTYNNNAYGGGSGVPFETKKEVLDNVKRKLRAAEKAHKITAIVGFILGGILAFVVLMLLLVGLAAGDGEVVTTGILFWYDVGYMFMMLFLIGVYGMIAAGFFVVASINIKRAKKINELLSRINTRPAGITNFYGGIGSIIAPLVVGALFFTPGIVGHIIELTARSVILNNRAILWEIENECRGY